MYWKVICSTGRRVDPVLADNAQKALEIAKTTGAIAPVVWPADRFEYEALLQRLGVIDHEYA